MSRLFEELDWQATPMGELTLRRRRDPVLEQEVYEVKLGEEFLMSSAFTVAEIELARLVLAETAGDGLDVLVGGLGLGYTAVAALEDPRVATLRVVEALEPVIDWHRRRLLPVSPLLVGDARARLVHADFFAVAEGRVRVPEVSDGAFDAVLLDIDHTPRHVLAEGHRSFYSVSGLSSMAERLRSGGVLGIWSDDPPDEEFLAVLSQVYDDVTGRRVTFPNAYTGAESSNTVYLARRRGARS